MEAGELSVSGNVVHGSGLERGYVRKGPRSEHGMRPIALDPHTVQALGARNVVHAVVLSEALFVT